MTGTSGPRTGRVRGLPVDDEPALDEVPSAAVIEAGRRPNPAPDGRSALRTARGCAPHAVVLAGTLPDLDGLQALHRPCFENPKPPVLTLTAKEYDLLGPSTRLPPPSKELVSIPRLRRKIHTGRAPMIRPVRGLGYAIRAAEDGR